MIRIAVVTCALSLLLSACQLSDSPTDHFEDYLKRLERTLLIDPDWGPVTGRDAQQSIKPLPPIGKPSDREWPIVEKAKSSLLLYIRVDGCSELKQLIAQRNSQMGQHQPLPLRFQHEIQIRTALDSCIAEQETEEDAAEIVELAQLKAATLPADLWNTLFATAWFSKFAYSTQFIDWEQNDTLAAAAQAIEFYASSTSNVLRQSGDNWPEASRDYTTWFKALDEQNTLGKLLHSLIYATHYINAGTEWIASVDRKRYCPAGMRRKEHDYFKNVVTQVYVGQVQPYLSRLSRDGGRLLKALDEILLSFEKSPGVEAYWETAYRADNSIWSEYQSAVKRHALAISQLNEDCGLGLTRR